jgi:hypothetical protein
MKALEILNKLVKEMKSSYACTLDFDRWTTVNSNFEVMHESIAYCIDYSITGNRQVKSTLSVMKPDMVDGRKTWFKCGTDKDFRLFIETSINQILPILFDEFLNREIEEDNERDAAIKDEIEMCETYQSLENFR